MPEELFQDYACSCESCNIIRDVRALTRCHTCHNNIPPESQTVIVDGDTFAFCSTCFTQNIVPCLHCERNSHIDYTYTINTPEGQRNCCPDCRHHFISCPSCACLSTEPLTIQAPENIRICTACANRVFTCEGCDTLLWRNSTLTNYCQNCIASFSTINNTTFNTNKSSRTVGIEIEFCSRTVPQTARFGKLKGDGSLRPTISGTTPHELATYISSGDATLTLIDNIIEEFSHHEAYVNETCGLHVHLGMSTEPSQNRNNLCDWWYALEPLFFQMVSPSRKNNQYCKSNRLHQERWNSFRYLALNTSALSKFGTYEVRLHHGTLNSTELKDWVIFLTSFFDTFTKITPTQKDTNLVYRYTLREKLIFIFQQCKLPLSLRKRIIKKLSSQPVNNKNDHNIAFKKTKKRFPSIDLTTEYINTYIRNRGAI
jgi:hypothetical protein